MFLWFLFVGWRYCGFEVQFLIVERNKAFHVRLHVFTFLNSGYCALSSYENRGTTRWHFPKSTDDTKCLHSWDAIQCLLFFSTTKYNPKINSGLIKKQRQQCQHQIAFKWVYCIYVLMPRHNGELIDPF